MPLSCDLGMEVQETCVNEGTQTINTVAQLSESSRHIEKGCAAGSLLRCGTEHCSLYYTHTHTHAFSSALLQSASATHTSPVGSLS